MNTKFLKQLKALLMWVPFVLFFSILITMMMSQFKNPTDEYFVSTVLRACLILILATFIAQFVSVAVVATLSYAKMHQQIQGLENILKSISSFPIVDIGIYSVALFVAYPEYQFWYHTLTVLLVIPTLYYWFVFLRGPIRNLHQFAMFHQIKSSRAVNVLSTFYVAAYIDYYFIVLKRSLLPMVFVLAVMDFRIMLPRLVEAGMSSSAFIMFLSLIVSLHLLTMGKEKNT